MAWKTFLSFGCTHRPAHCPDYCDWIVAQVREHQPDIIVLTGDLFDQKCVSRFAKQSAPTLMEEYESADEFLTTINDVHGAGRKRIFLEGNHCSRVFREEHSHLSALLDFRLHVPSLRAWDTSRRYRPHPDHVYTLGQVTFGHGWKVSVAGIRSEAMRLGVPGGLYVHSHTHRGHEPTQVVAASTPLPYYVANTGCGINGDEPYFQEWDVSQWNRGYVWGACDTAKRDRNHPHWEAEFVLHSRFW